MALLRSSRSRQFLALFGVLSLFLLPAAGAPAAALGHAGSGPALAAPPAPRVDPQWLRPVPGDVVNPFAGPTSTYGRGHRGVDLASTAGAPVRAAGAGRVRFAGAVAGRSLVVIQHPSGQTTEYEPVTPTVQTGAEVEAGQIIGRLSGAHAACRRACVHWAAKSGSAYFDPLELLVPLTPVRLLPWNQARG